MTAHFGSLTHRRPETGCVVDRSIQTGNAMNEIPKIVAEAIRPLGAMEEFIFLLKQIYSPTVVVGVEIIGEIQPMRLKSAFERICLQSPHLQARASRKGTRRPHFFTASPPSVGPFEVLPLLGTHLNTILGEETIKSFSPEDAPVRATLLAGEQRSILILSADHMMLDGRGVAYLIEDILHAAKDSAQEGKASMSLSQDELLGLDVASAYAAGSMGGPKIASDRAALPAPSIENVEIGEQEMVEFRQLARMGGTTFHALLTAAILETGRLLSKSWQNRAVTFTSVVDNRPLFDQAARLGCYISFASGEYPASQTPFLWEQATAIRKGITEQTTHEAVARQMMGLQEALAADVRPEDSVNLVGTYDLLVTNYGQVTIRREFDGLRIKKLMPHVISPGVQTVSVATVGHDLYMSNVSFEPIPQLLAQSKKRLFDLLAV